MFNIPAQNLISHTRFDLIIKLLFAKSFLRGHKTKFYRDMYKHHLEIWNGFKEYNNNNKNTYKKFEECFIDLIKDIEKNGFNKNISTVPVVDGKYILNGSHRVAAAIAHNEQVWCNEGLNGRDGQLNCNFSFFRELGLNETYMDQTAVEYCKLQSNTYVVCMFPIVNNKITEAYNIINNIGNIFYTKQLTLNKTGAFNLMRELYLGESWAGNHANNYAGYKEKANLCFPNYSPITAVLVNLNNLEEAKMLKASLRGLFNVGNHCVHINDTHSQSVRISKTLFNKNSVHYLNNAIPTNYTLFNSCMNEYNAEINNKKLNIDDYCIGGSAPLAAYGLRECKDLDYLHFNENLIYGTRNLIHSHNEYGVGRYHLDREDIIYNPENYFYHRGMKFAALDTVRRLKSKRNESKDVVDVELINKVLPNV